MGLLDGVLNAVTGGLGSDIVKAVASHFPPDMSEEQKAAVKLAADNLELQRMVQATTAMGDAEKSLNERIALYEGTASDLKGVPYLGALMLFLRGAQRPIWGFATIYLDYLVFTGQADKAMANPTTASAFWVINVLVLSFLFGERALTNLMPLITQMMSVTKK